MTQEKQQQQQQQQQRPKLSKRRQKRQRRYPLTPSSSRACQALLVLLIILSCAVIYNLGYYNDQPPSSPNDNIHSANSIQHPLSTLKRSPPPNHNKPHNNNHDSSRQHPPHLLRYDWSNLSVHSEVAHWFDRIQNDCTKPIRQVPFRNRFGLGSDLHVWTQAVCNAAAQGYRLHSIPPWNWLDESMDCRKKQNYQDNSQQQEEDLAMSCYFPNVEGRDCQYHEAHDKGKARQGYQCDDILGKQFTVEEFRAGGIEFLFQNVSSAIIQEAERQLKLVFPPNGVVPPNLITVQIRWGDKVVEMKTKTKIEQFIDAVYQILKLRQFPRDYPAHIFLATEDLSAIRQFHAHAPPSWTIHVDAYHTELHLVKQDVNMDPTFTHSKGQDYNENPRISRATKGRAGLVALGSLLVAMEANDFVLTTTSNWSRLMNELRKAVLDPRCQHCTNMIDLLPGEW